WPYVCATPFLSDLPIDEPRDVGPRLPTALARVLGAGVGGQPTAIFVDLAPEVSLPATTELNRQGYIVVPVIQRWAASPAVIPCERLIARLIEFGRLAKTPANPRGVVFFLDGGRFGRRQAGIETGPSKFGAHRLANTRRFDNRYEYPICRFPPPELLRKVGIRQTVWLPEAVAPDLQPYAARLVAACIGSETAPPNA